LEAGHFAQPPFVYVFTVDTRFRRENSWVAIQDQQGFS